MTNVIFSRKDFEKEIPLNKENIEKISLFGTPLESIDDEKIEIEIFPNRPDLISFQGYIRAFKSFLDINSGLKKYKVTSSNRHVKVKVDKSVSEVRPHTVCSIVRNMSFDDKKIKQIMDLQEKLHITIGRNREKAAIGIYSLEKISFPIRYMAIKPSEIKFIPLGARKEMSGKQIIKNHPLGKEFADILKGKKEYPIFIDSKDRILSMPPIVNSEDLGKIEEKTKDVFVECSGSDLKILKKVLNIITTTLADMGGEIYSVKIEGKEKITTPDLSPEKKSISINNVNSLLGLTLKEKEIKTLLEKMGYGYDKKSVLVPAWRADILHEVDLIEDIAIAYGYDKLSPEIPKIATIGEELQDNKIKSIITDILIGLGLTEISTYHLIKTDEAKKLKIKPLVEVENSKTEYKLLRTNLLAPLLRILSENKDSEYPQKIFEIGTVFSLSDKEETGIKESTNLIVALTPGNFTEIKQHLVYIFSLLETNYSLKEYVYPGLVDGRTGQIMLNGKEAGYVGEVHPQTLREFGLKMPVSIMEINLDSLKI